MADEVKQVSPFSELKIASHEVLRGVQRRPCPKCQASRKYFCYTCYMTVGLDRRLIPMVHLPIKVDIIKHQKELVGKSTATHACILAPENVSMHNYPEVPDFQENEMVIIVFPAEDAVTLEKIRLNHDRQTADHYRWTADQDRQTADCNRQTVDQDRQAADQDRQLANQDRQPADHNRQTADQDRQLANQDRQPADHNRQTAHQDKETADPSDAGALLHRVVFIDSTWQQSHQIITDKKLKGLKRVKLESAVTHFWRPQRKPDTCLATIEAIYYFFKEYDQHILKREYDGRYDNLLYFFAFQYNLIQEQRKNRKKRKMSENEQDE